MYSYRVQKNAFEEKSRNPFEFPTRPKKHLNNLIIVTMLPILIRSSVCVVTLISVATLIRVGILQKDLQRAPLKGNSLHSCSWRAFDRTEFNVSVAEIAPLTDQITPLGRHWKRFCTKHGTLLLEFCIFCIFFLECENKVTTPKIDLKSTK